MTATTEAARLSQALRNCSPEASQAYDLIVKLTGHADLVVVLSALYHAVDQFPGDTSEVCSYLQEAEGALDEVYVTSLDQVAVWVAEDLAEQRRAE